MHRQPQHPQTLHKQKYVQLKPYGTRSHFSCQVNSKTPAGSSAIRPVCPFQNDMYFFSGCSSSPVHWTYCSYNNLQSGHVRCSASTAVKNTSATEQYVANDAQPPSQYNKGGCSNLQRTNNCSDNAVNTAVSAPLAPPTAHLLTSSMAIQCGAQLKKRQLDLLNPRCISWQYPKHPSL